MGVKELEEQVEEAVFAHYFTKIPFNDRTADVETIVRETAKEHARAVITVANKSKNGKHYPLLFLDGYKSYIEMLPELRGVGGEAMIIDGRINWQDISLNALIGIKAQEIARQERRRLDQIKKEARPKANLLLKNMDKTQFLEEKERLIEQIRDRFPESSCTIKIPKPGGIITEREERGRAFAGLKYPGILCYLEHTASRGKEIIVMQRVENLVDYRDIPYAFTVDQILSVWARTAKALAFCHENNVIHRDIKPDNILIDKKTNSYVADLGLIKLHNKDKYGIDNETSLRSINLAPHILGTPAYNPPEALFGATESTGKSDVYQLAATFYELITGLPPNQPKAGMNANVVMINTSENLHGRGDRLVRVSQAGDKKIYSEFRGRQLKGDRQFDLTKRKLEYMELMIAYGMQPKEENRPTMGQYAEDLDQMTRGYIPDHLRRVLQNTSPQDLIETVFDSNRTLEDIKHLL